MIKATDLRRGQVVRIDGEIYIVFQMEHVTPGKGHAHVQSKMKSFKTGKMIPMRFNSSDPVDNVFVEKNEMEYLYADDRMGVFMDTTTYDQIEISLDQIEDQLKFMLPNTNVIITLFDGKPLGVELGTTVVLEVVEAPPAVRGNTATNVTKECITETGLVVKTPHYIEQGEKIKVDSRTGDFVERVKS